MSDRTLRSRATQLFGAYRNQASFDTQSSGNLSNAPSEEPSENEMENENENGIVEVDPVDEGHETPLKFNYNLCLKIIPNYGGAFTHLKKFLDTADVMAATCTTQTEKTLFLTILLSKLTGIAYKLTVRNEFKTYENLKAALRQHFGRHRSIAQLQAELTKQKQFNDVREFVAEITSALSTLNEAIRESEGMELTDEILKLNEMMAMRTFMTNLEPSISIIVRSKGPTTLAEAIEIALAQDDLNEGLRDEQAMSPHVLYYRGPVPVPISDTYPPRRGGQYHSYNAFHSRTLHNNFALQPRPNYSNTAQTGYNRPRPDQNGGNAFQSRPQYQNNASQSRANYGNADQSNHNRTRPDQNEMNEPPMRRNFNNNAYQSRPQYDNNVQSNYNRPRSDQNRDNASPTRPNYGNNSNQFGHNRPQADRGGQNNNSNERFPNRSIHLAETSFAGNEPRRSDATASGASML
jgi:hypothetical protein